MRPGRIEGTTRVFGKPADWDDEKGVCGGLPVRDEMTEVGPSMTSAWFPTVEEIAAIAAGAPVYLEVLGTVHPPVMVTVGEPPKEGGG